MDEVRNKWLEYLPTDFFITSMQKSSKLKKKKEKRNVSLKSIERLKSKFFKHGFPLLFYFSWEEKEHGIFIFHISVWPFFSIKKKKDGKIKTKTLGNNCFKKENLEGENMLQKKNA